MSKDVTLTLATSAAMFAAPEPDPLAPGFSRTSGIERVLAEVGARQASQRRGGRLILRSASATAMDPRRMAAAVRAYCAARGEDLALRQASVWREGMQTLWLAAAFIVVCVTLATLARAWLDGPGLMRTLARDGLVIAGWVALWRPIDMLLFETWLLRRERRVLEAVAEMPVVDAEALPGTPLRTA